MIIDNKQHGRVGDVLKQSLTSNADVSIMTNRFSIFAFQELRKELSSLNSLRLLLSNPLDHAAALLGNESERSYRNRLIQSSIAKELATFISKKTKCRQTIIPQLGTNLTYSENANNTFALQGSSEFSAEGLGYAPSGAFAMNTLLDDAATVAQMREWFESIWSSDASSIEVKSQLLEMLEQLGSDNTPDSIYFTTLYRLFSDITTDLNEDSIIKPRTGFKETIVWSKLYNFQRDGVLGAIDKLERYNGCIIADSVGLGKTFEALAVIKYYELRNDRVLVLCPKKLRDNWAVYTINDKRNVLANDRFNYDVLNHTDLTREGGKSGEIDLRTINWGNYDLIVIDESHNFRNNNPRKDGVTRYSKLMNDSIKSGVKTKVLMLSATPVNNRLSDLKNQIYFITEGENDAFADEGIAHIENSLNRAQKQFNQWQNLPEERRSVARLLDMINFEYFKLLDLITIARSRKHIDKYYDTTAIGTFPERLIPLNIKSDIDLKNEFPPLLSINRTIRRLSLAAYSPFKYILPGRVEEYSAKYDTTLKSGSVLRQSDREQSLIHLLRVNMLKRMESSINSFALTIGKFISLIDDLLRKIDKHEDLQFEDISILDIDTESDTFSDNLIGKKIKVLLQDIDLVRWRQDLEDDRDKLSELLEASQLIDKTRDAKLSTLHSLIEAKVTHPINPDNKKIIIFTAFADTANYLYAHVAEWAKRFGIHSALVTGTGANKTTMQGVDKDLNTILTNFSPRSKEREKISPELSEQIDILIATDCISEGQNLQDCDYLINYDIHWNPVRIIQRFGRVDRLGSTNKVIQLVNFWPNMELDEYINLESRVSGRMVLLDISATGEENVIDIDESSQMNDLEYRRKQLQQLQEQVVDIEDLSGGISITDLTLNDIKMDLLHYQKEHKDRLEKSPMGLFGVVESVSELAQPGVIFCLRSFADQKTTQTALEPYYLVYLNDDGEVLLHYTQGKKILDIYRTLCKTTSFVQHRALEAFNTQTSNAKEMRHYQNLLKIAVESIVGKKQEAGVASLFSVGGISIGSGNFRGLEDFEVVTYLIIKEGA